MKKCLFVIMLVLLLAPSTSFAEYQSENTVGYNPYNIVSSNGEVIEVSELLDEINRKNIKLPEKMTKGKGLSNNRNEEIYLNVPDYNEKNITYSLSTLMPIDTSNEFSTNAIIGTDNRKLVTNTSVSPHKMISYLMLDFGNNIGGTCTGTVIGKDMVLTNAHCVIDLEDDLEVQNVTVIPAVKDSHYSFGAYTMKDFYIPQGYRETGGSSQYDFAIIKVNKYINQEIGAVVGTLPIKEVTNISGNTIKIYGYPGDKIRETGLVNQWGHSGPVTQENTNLAFYEIDTNNGQSGSALLNSSNQVVGVHNASYRLNGNTINGGPKMTKPFYSFITVVSLLN